MNKYQQALDFFLDNLTEEYFDWADLKAKEKHTESIQELIDKEKPIEWTFTEDEKIILRNLYADYHYIARDRDGTLAVYEWAPYKVDDRVWEKPNESSISIQIDEIFGESLFKSVKWSDDEPCDFRKYIS